LGQAIFTPDVPHCTGVFDVCACSKIYFDFLAAHWHTGYSSIFLNLILLLCAFSRSSAFKAHIGLRFMSPTNELQHTVRCSLGWPRNKT